MFKAIIILVILAGITWMGYDLYFESVNSYKVKDRLEGYYGYNDVTVSDSHLSTSICAFDVKGNVRFTATYKGEYIRGTYCWDVERTQGGPHLYH